jgi:hypothetical protein
MVRTRAQSAVRGLSVHKTTSGKDKWLQVRSVGASLRTEERRKKDKIRPRPRHQHD